MCVHLAVIVIINGPPRIRTACGRSVLRRW